MEGLVNASLALEPPDISDDLIDFVRSDAIDLGHVAKIPMVRLHSIRHSPLERGIAMMVRLVNLMHQRRSMVGSCRLASVAGHAVGIKFPFASLKLGRNRTAPNRWLGLRRIACHEEA
ncbi:MAG: hypothetical protein JW388_1073 [Nitrospira sp.]|nr:hypothetical protein [Nitrospira sp.]